MTGWTLIRAGALTLAVLVMMLLPAMAQIIQIDPPTEGPPSSAADDRTDQPLFTLPERRGRDPGTATAIATPVGSLAENRLVPLRMASPRSNGQQISRLSGDVARERFILFLPASPGATDLQLVTRSGIDLLPEASILRISVNGTFLDNIVPDNFTTFTEDRVFVPDGVLLPGRNIVEVEARQTHRIACGPDASFALWTEIDARASGVQMAASAFNTDALGFLSAVAAQAALGQPIEIRRPDPEASLIEAAQFIGQGARALGGTPPAIASTSYWPLAGTSPSLARITALPVGQGSSEPRFERGGDGAIVLVLDSASDYARISKNLLGAAQGPSNGGVRMLTTGVAQPLSDLHPQSLTGEGRYILLSVPFQLPWDWLLLSSQKARLDLEYRFAGGLPDGSLMLVKVNGTTVRLLPLDVGGGTDLPSLPISFGASLLRPGANQLDFEVLVPGDPVDQACALSPVPVVEIAESSQLFVPKAPSMSLPSIDRSLANVSLAQIRQTASAADVLAPGFAPQVAAALALLQGAQPPFDVGQLTIGTLADLEATHSGWLGDDLGALARVLTSERLRDLAGASAQRPKAWDVVAVAENVEIAAAGGLADLPRRMVSRLRQMAFGDVQTLNAWLVDRTAQAALLQPDVEAPGDIWLIMGPQAVPEEIARSLAVTHTGSGGPTGQVAIFTSTGEWQSWTAPDRPLRLHETVGLSTFRDIFGNYATHRPTGFIAVIFGLTVLSASAGLVLLLVTRRSPG